MSGVSRQGSNSTAELQRVISRIRAEFPNFEIKKKSDSILMKRIDKLLRIVSFGRMSSFMTGFITTIGQTVYVNDRWGVLAEFDRAIVLRHEAVHMRQLVRMGWLLFAYSYLLCPLPAFFCFGRCKLEREAYAETLKARAEYYGLEYIQIDTYKDFIIEFFTGPSYMWMWPFRRSCEIWYDGVVAAVKKDLERRNAEEGQYL